jgi:hypothetical protein
VVIEQRQEDPGRSHQQHDDEHAALRRTEWPAIADRRPHLLTTAAAEVERHDPATQNPPTHRNADQRERDAERHPLRKRNFNAVGAIKDAHRDRIDRRTDRGGEAADVRGERHRQDHGRREVPSAHVGRWIVRRADDRTERGHGNRQHHDGGGRIIAEGTPEDVAKVKGSYTGKFLGPLLKKKP